MSRWAHANFGNFSEAIRKAAVKRWPDMPAIPAGEPEQWTGQLARSGSINGG
ncbi:hypothetical protein C8E87_1659 [Paractinoplanes brasiliensis]|uniref:Uncharacterized protein n=1 Tax=Paractinoplanes brasiliensis TaxID=52695 RepID=A0A4R6JPX9_9ACTN|nr:hypothetical protein C8E87_1659 [Actinoplanes brasiliensis]